MSTVLTIIIGILGFALFLAIFLAIVAGIGLGIIRFIRWAWTGEWNPKKNKPNKYSNGK